MGSPTARRGTPAGDDARTQPRFAVIVSRPGKPGADDRIVAPGRLLRTWALLKATASELDTGTLPPERLPRLQHQLRVIRRELEHVVSGPLAAELGRLIPPDGAAPTADALRVEASVLLGWTSGLVIQMADQLMQARPAAQRPSR